MRWDLRKGLCRWARRATRAAGLGLLAALATIPLPTARTTAATPKSAPKAAPKSTNTAKPLSQRNARLECVQGIPWQSFDRETREEVQQLTKAGAIFRRLPAQVIPCDPRLFSFMLENPELLVNIWDVMGISKVTMTRTGPNEFTASDGAGTSCNLRVIHRAQDMQVVLADGVYEGPAFPKAIRGRCLLVLRSASLQETDGREYITARLDAFIDFDQVGLDLIAKTLQPWIGRIADYNFSETVGFVGSLSRTAEVNPLGVQRLSTRLNRVDPAVSARFGELSLDIARLAAERQTSNEVARLARVPGASGGN